MTPPPLGSPAAFRSRKDASGLFAQISNTFDPGAVLLVCATGGHLAQLHRIAPRLDVAENQRLWVTFDSPQSRSLLRDEHVIFVPYTKPRDLPHVLSNGEFAFRLLATDRFSYVVSTGSGIALSFLPIATLRGIRSVYIESAARSDGPSLTGRMLGRVPGISRCTQYRSWESSDWRFIGSVFDDYERGADQQTPQRLKVVVTLGTIRGYSFARLVQHLQKVLPPNADVLWQTGETQTREFGVDGIPSMPARDLERAMATADVVVAHAGIGSALSALDSGRTPILVPRRSGYREHVDDHQLQIATELDARGIALHREAESLTTADLWDASRRTVVQVQAPQISIAD